MPNGGVQPEFKERLDYIGKWLSTYGESIYNRRAGYLKPQQWGVVTEKDGKMYIHLLKKDSQSINLENFPYKKITNAYLLKDRTNVATAFKNGTVTVTTSSITNKEPDQVIVLETKL